MVKSDFKMCAIIAIIAVLVAVFLWYSQQNGAASKNENFTTTEGLYGNMILTDKSGNMNSIQFPRGIIMMWYSLKNDGTMANIPEGWALCDGKNGTPDLRGRFVMGMNPNQRANPNFTVKEFNTATGSENVSTALSINNLPAHTHTYYSGRRNKGVCGTSCADTNTVTNNNLNLSHETSSTGSGRAFTLPVVPPFMVMAYIMKII